MSRVSYKAMMANWQTRYSKEIGLAEAWRMFYRKDGFPAEEIAKVLKRAKAKDKTLELIEIHRRPVPTRAGVKVKRVWWELRWRTKKSLDKPVF